MRFDRLAVLTLLVRFDPVRFDRFAVLTVQSCFAVQFDVFDVVFLGYLRFGLTVSL